MVVAVVAASLLTIVGMILMIMSFDPEPRKSLLGALILLAALAVWYHVGSSVLSDLSERPPTSDGSVEQELVAR